MERSTAAEACVAIFDVGSTMSRSKKQLAKDAFQQMLLQKMMFKPKAEMGIVLLGSEQTRNHLNEEIEEEGENYVHISTFSYLKTIQLSLLNELDDIVSASSSTDAASLIDGLIVAFDLLCRHTGKKSYERRILLFTDFEFQISDDLDMDDLHNIVESMRNVGCQLQVISIGSNQDELQMLKPDSSSSATDSTSVSIAQENHKMIQRIICHVNGEILYLKNPEDIDDTIRACQCKQVRQTTKFRGVLDIGSTCQIPIWIYTQTKQMNLKALTKESKVTSKVLNDRTYRRKDDINSNGFAKSERMNAYKYGSDNITVTEGDQLTMKLAEERSFYLLGCLPKEKFDLSMALCGTDIACAPTTKSNAQKTLSALVLAMRNKSFIAIARIVTRKDSDPKIVCLSPGLSRDYACFWVYQLPFLEDLRQFTFESLPRIIEGLSQKQKSAGSALVSQLTDSTRSIYDTQKCYNPYLQRYYLTVQHRAMDPNCLLPQLSPSVEKWSKPNEAFFEDAKGVVSDFKSSFPDLKKIKKNPTEQRHFWMNMQPNSLSEPQQKEINENEHSLASSAAQKDIPSIGEKHPIRDFEKILRSSSLESQHIDTAVSGFKQQIQNFIQKGDNKHRIKAIQCIEHFQSKASAINKTEQFNQFLVSLKQNFPPLQHPELWKDLAK